MIKSIVSKAFKTMKYEIKRRMINIEKLKPHDNSFIKVDIKPKSTSAIAVDSGYNYEITRYGIFYIILAIILGEKEKNLDILDSFADINLINYIKVRDAKEVLDIYRKIIEAKLLLKNRVKIKDALILYDGSLFSDLTNFLINYKNVKIDFFLNTTLTPLDYNVDFGKILSEYYTLLGMIINMKNLICIPKTFTKNIYLSKNIPEICMYSKIGDEGYTKPRYKFLELNGKRYVFSYFYVKFKDGNRILPVEVPGEISESDAYEISSRLKSISVKGYPYILKKAHIYSRVRKQELKFYMKRLNLKSLREELL